MVKLGARHRAQLVVLAHESGLVRPGWLRLSRGAPGLSARCSGGTHQVTAELSVQIRATERSPRSVTAVSGSRFQRVR